MRIFVTGGTGFIGQRLCQVLTEGGHVLTVLTRQPERHAKRLPHGVSFVKTFSEVPSNTAYDAVINLAGEGIADQRWTEARKQALLDSRVALTHELVGMLKRLEQPPGILLSGSAIGYYGDQGDKALHEISPGGHGFAHELCRQWESAALAAEPLGLRVCLLRIGVVLGPNGGALARMAPPFRMGLGGPIGSGSQYMSWIHRDDIIGAMQHLIDHPTLRGPVNLTAPEPVTNQAFAKTMGKVLGRPAILPTPPAALRLAFGQMAEELLISGQRVLPKVLLATGYEFKYPDLTSALRASLRPTASAA